MTVGCSCCTSRTHSPCSNGRPERAYWAFQGRWRRSTAGVRGIRRLGRISVPLPAPAVEGVGRLLHIVALSDHVPEQIRFLNFGRVMDTSRLRAELGFVPRWTTSHAFDDFARGAALRRTVDPEWAATA